MLLQEIRLKQALSEKGIDTTEYKISHKDPYIDVLGKRYVLVFPKFMFDYDLHKKTDILFMGLKTPSREKFLSKFDAKIIYSDRGRSMSTKQRDEWYFSEMAKARFVLCPDGDFVWTYRFFEAAIFRAIPIVENITDVYEGYHFYKWGDEFIYRQDWVEHNRNKVFNETTL